MIKDLIHQEDVMIPNVCSPNNSFEIHEAREPAGGVF